MHGKESRAAAACIFANATCARGVIPEGRIFHAAGPAPGGWQITSQPVETEWDVTHFYN